MVEFIMKIWWLKYRAEVWLKRVWSIEDSYDCSVSLLPDVSADYVRAKEAFNRIMDKLAALDDATPTGRL